jgi:UTP---glucose-1-phosphate uridylyltransferase
MVMASQQVHLQQQIESLDHLVHKLNEVCSFTDRIAIVNELPEVRDFFLKSPFLATFASSLELERDFVLKSVIAIGQGPIVFRGLNEILDPVKALENLLEILLQVEKSYKSLGGVIGYHLTLLKLIAAKRNPSELQAKNVRYLHPAGFEISKNTPFIDECLRWGIEHLHEIAEIYPVGGAGDRLNLSDVMTHEPLPAGLLNFCGRTLFERLFQDLQAREYLHYKLTKKNILTPVVLMTSHEKGNHQHILEICEEHHWFGRPKESIRCIVQPLIPVVTIEGNWCTTGPLQLTLKPGGHGVLWQVALETGIFNWLASQKRRKILIRQINNPIAAMDNGLLIFAGLGIKKNKFFGFASCGRLLNSPEGMDVLIEKHAKDGFEYCLTNVEYTEFENKGLKDTPLFSDSPYSTFPSNTNILFADIEEISRIAREHPFPGLLINMKSKASYIDKEGRGSFIESGRLEATMQNIADYIVEKSPSQLSEEKQRELKSYITFNHRRKTISVVKSLYVKDKPIQGTPEGCLYEILENYFDLFNNYCQFSIPPMPPLEEYLEKGPSFFVLLHPALGPMFNLIAQKIQCGTIASLSELQLEIADIEIKNLFLDGSFRVIAQNSMGKVNEEGYLVYAHDTSKCILRDVMIKNKGIDRQLTTIKDYWSNQPSRTEEMCIKLYGNGEFIAENIRFTGHHLIEVPDGQRIIALQDNEKIKFHSEPIKTSAPLFQYSFNQQNQVVLIPQR